MTVVQLVFYFFAALTVSSALFILFTKNVLHAVLSLLAVFLGVSAMYVFAGAEFLAITQLVIYVGGVLVLMLFGVMLTNRESGALFPLSKNNYFIPGILAGSSIFGILSYILIRNQSVFSRHPTTLVLDKNASLKLIGISLMTEYVLVFEVMGVLLLIALIGAAFIAGRKA